MIGERGNASMGGGSNIIKQGQTRKEKRRKKRKTGSLAGKKEAKRECPKGHQPGKKRKGFEKENRFLFSPWEAAREREGRGHRKESGSG